MRKQEVLELLFGEKCLRYLVGLNVQILSTSQSVITHYKRSFPLNVHRRGCVTFQSLWNKFAQERPPQGIHSEQISSTNKAPTILEAKPHLEKFLAKTKLSSSISQLFFSSRTASGKHQFLDNVTHSTSFIHFPPTNTVRVSIKTLPSVYHTSSAGHKSLRRNCRLTQTNSNSPFCLWSVKEQAAEEKMAAVVTEQRGS